MAAADALGAVVRAAPGPSRRVPPPQDAVLAHQVLWQLVHQHQLSAVPNVLLEKINEGLFIGRK